MIKDDFWEFFRERDIKRQRIESLMRKSQDIVDYCKRMTGGGDYWQISEDEIRVIYTLVKSVDPSIVVETGVGPGVSTTAILSALSKDSLLISIDPDIPYGKGDREIGFVIPDELKSNFKFVRGTSAEKMREVLENIGELDVFFHDSDHTYNNIMFELNSIWPRLSRDYIILVDNYDWTAAPMDFAREKNLTLYNPADDLAIISKPRIIIGKQ
ncbi:MAG: class I SAM-dependent methyltransferase [Thermoplasmata archaeon]